MAHPPIVINTPELFRPVSRLDELRQGRACVVLRPDKLTLGNSQCVFTRSVEGYWQPMRERAPLEQRNRISGHWAWRLWKHAVIFFLLTYKAVFITMQHITKKNNVKVLDVTFLQSKLPNDLTWKRRKGYQGCYIAFFSIRTCMALSTQHQFTC